MPEYLLIAQFQDSQHVARLWAPEIGAYKLSCWVDRDGCWLTSACKVWKGVNRTSGDTWFIFCWRSPRQSLQILKGGSREWIHQSTPGQIGKFDSKSDRSSWGTMSKQIVSKTTAVSLQRFTISERFILGIRFIVCRFCLSRRFYSSFRLFGLQLRLWEINVNF